MIIKKIYIIIGSLSFGGAERVTITLSKWLLDKGYDVKIVTINKHDKEYKLESNIKRISLSQNQSKFKKIFQLKSLMADEKPDTILVMGVPLLVYVYPAILGLNIPLIVSERNDPANFDGKKTTRYISRFFLKFVDGIVFQTEQAKKYYSKQIQRKSCVIPNPLLIKNLPQPYEGKRTNKIVSIGRLVKQKNHILLIKSFKEVYKKHPDYKLIIYGEGPERDILEHEIKLQGLNNNVLLPGIKSNVLEEIMDAKMFVLSSNFEGIPNALIEAMAIGLPCISTNTPSGGPASLIKNGENGILVPVKDKESLASAMNTLIINKELSYKISSNAKKIRDELNMDVICKKWIEFLKRNS